ncbi:MAG: hypothetical protein B6D55_02905 [Candidatus Omnitrophica bacterium 4484_70.2]|nr:MAG: hypothetical protein B6D55_02905 [Candidatus Omnitrophica bacterium 4484_70.2]
MKTFIKIAWRNIWRNKYRTTITLLGISLGLTSLIFIRSFIDGADTQMIENYTNLVTGHIQIHKKGFKKRVSLELSIEEPYKIEKILKKFPQIKAFTKRIKNYALISSSENSSGILLIGIEPEKEKLITNLNKHIKKGKFLSKDNEIIIGKTLAEVLNVDIGEKVAVMSQGYDGSLCAQSYRVCGILDTGAEEFDRSIAIITLNAAQNLLVLGKKVSEFVIHSSVYKIDKLKKDLEKVIDTQEFEVLSWKEISPIMVQWLEFDRAFSNVILLIVLIVVSASILNTMLMAVMERTKEFGIMRALGTKKRQIIFLVALESSFLGIIGIILGTILGISISLYFSYKGIDLSKFSQALESYYTGSVIYPRIFLGYTTLWILIVFLTTVVSSLYPAYKAANLKPAEALRFQ